MFVFQTLMPTPVFLSLHLASGSEDHSCYYTMKANIYVKQIDII